MNYKISTSEIFIICLWLYIITNTTLYVYDFSTHYLIELVALFIMGCIWVSYGSLRRYQLFDKTILLYICAIVCLLFPDLISTNIAGLNMGINLFLPIIILFLILSRQTHFQNSKLFLAIPLYYGFIIAFQSMLLEFTSICGFEIGGCYEIIEKNNFQQRFVYDFLLGLQSTIFNLGNGHKVLRLNGYYLEPAKFAFFLSIPLFLSYFKYRASNKKLYLFMAITIASCWFFTFSRAGYVSVFIAIGIYRILNNRKKSDLSTSYKDVIKVVSKTVKIILIIYLLFYIVNIFIQNGQTTNYLLQQFTFSENGSVTLIRSKSSNFSEILNLLLRQPYGYGMTILMHDGGKNDFNVANAFSFWLYGAGFLGAIIIVINLVHLSIHYAIPAIKSNEWQNKALGMIFFTQTIFALSYGTWLNPDYIFTVAALICYERVRRNEVFNCC